MNHILLIVISSSQLFYFILGFLLKILIFRQSTIRHVWLKSKISSSPRSSWLHCCSSSFPFSSSFVFACRKSTKQHTVFVELNADFWSISHLSRIRSTHSWRRQQRCGDVEMCSHSKTASPQMVNWEMLIALFTHADSIPNQFCSLDAFQCSFLISEKHF